MNSPLALQYDGFVENGTIKDDPAQREVLAVLQLLREQLVSGGKSNGRLLSRFIRKQPANTTRGIYIWGNVGRGKSMLMDLFYNSVNIGHKRRVHFHAFMQEVHARIHKLRQNPQANRSGADPVIVLAQQIAGETTLLCFDELQATDVADATLLYRLFNQLFEAGVIVVSTSNHPPASLYTGGVQRERFGKFIALIEEHMHVVSLSSPQDYRHLQLKSLQQMYYYPLDAGANPFVTQVIERVCNNTHPKQETITVHGRSLTFTLYDDAIGRFRFAELCETALGPADYLSIARRMDMVILTDIPKLGPEKRNEAKRFVTLIDALYEHKVKLICTAEVAPEALYAEGDGAFEFKRTVSRLAEMQSAKWMDHE